MTFHRRLASAGSAPPLPLALPISAISRCRAATSEDSRLARDDEYLGREELAELMAVEALPEREADIRRSRVLNASVDATGAEAPTCSAGAPLSLRDGHR